MQPTNQHNSLEPPSGISAECETLSAAEVLKYRLRRNDDVLTYAEVLEFWKHSVEFCRFFNELLAASSLPAFRFETPCLTDASLDRPFEFVLLDASSFCQRKTDHRTFRNYFTEDEQNGGIVSFPSLGGDSLLVVPSPRTDDEAYGHLAAFVRKAPQTQTDVLWRVVSRHVAKRLRSGPVWLNTEGGGVAWLHVRIDSTPKYYSYMPYRQRVH